jgi:hypothetical protein
MGPRNRVFLRNYFVFTDRLGKKPGFFVGVRPGGRHSQAKAWERANTYALTGSQAKAWEPRSRGSASLADKNMRQSLMEGIPRLRAWERANTYAFRFRRRMSTLMTCFGLAARCTGLQSPTEANPRRYKVSMVSLTPLGEPVTVTHTTSCSDSAAESSFGRSEFVVVRQEFL